MNGSAVNGTSNGAAAANGNSPVEVFDAVVIGAGLSGINTAYRLREAFPECKFVILERYDQIGGTWAFWKYPGIRTDSSLAAYGYRWHPWAHSADFAPGPLIRDYIEEAARTQGLDKYIRFGHNVKTHSWSSDEQMWTLEVEQSQGSGRKILKTNWMFMCEGYYDYNKPRQTEIPGLDRFQGEVVHPQFWKPEHDCTGKRVVLIGSGATAVTIIPSIVEQAAHVTMLQRSPTYVLTLPKKDQIRSLLRRLLGLNLSSRIDWWRRCVLEVMLAHGFLIQFPNLGRRYITQTAKKSLPPGYPVETHFNPSYNPFEQRVCMTPDGDFFDAISRPDCQVVTAEIETCDEKGIKLKPGPRSGIDQPERLDADMIITATGLYMQLLDGKMLVVDGKDMPVGERYVWRSCMFDGVPNACYVHGYIAGSWTPGADARVRTALSVMKHQKKIGATSSLPYIPPEERAKMPRRPLIPTSSTYVQEAMSRLPLVTPSDPWMQGRHALIDIWRYWFGDLTKGMKYIMGSQDAKKTV